jgi:DNA ligase-1
MTLTERCTYLNDVFDMLQATNSPIMKRHIIANIRPELEEDFEYIIEVLAGKYVYGYSYWQSDVILNGVEKINQWSIKEVLQWLQSPKQMGDLSINNVTLYVRSTSPWGWFLEPIVNRTLRLGIGKSILPRDGLAPMLAKKYEGSVKMDRAGYVITEKLDGNRCIASYEDNHWVFRSRNGKLMHVNFDMGDLPKEYVYDGEVMSRSQTMASVKLHEQILAGNKSSNPMYSNEFSSTSGLINRHTLNKDLVYNIFDVMIDCAIYVDRRTVLSELLELDRGDDVRILPALDYCTFDQLNMTSSNLLHAVTSMGGEGIMINLCSGIYNHKRTDQLLKLKKVQTIDMRVDDFDWGNGKYEGMIGALKASCKTEDGKIISCDIGSGLSDEQRLEWALDFNKIKGKIVEVAYFSLSQTAKDKGTNLYSLRFPRLKSIRKDKVETSEY